jgi:hypothetical protein
VFAAYQTDVHQCAVEGGGVSGNGYGVNAFTSSGYDFTSNDYGVTSYEYGVTSNNHFVAIHQSEVF